MTMAATETSDPAPAAKLLTLGGFGMVGGAAFAMKAAPPLGLVVPVGIAVAAAVVVWVALRDPALRAALRGDVAGLGVSYLVLVASAFAVAFVGAAIEGAAGPAGLAGSVLLASVLVFGGAACLAGIGPLLGAGSRSPRA